MNKKYYADITLDFDDMKYSIVGEMDTKKQEMIDLVKDFAKRNKMECNTKTKKLLKNGQEVGTYEIGSRII